MYIVTSSVVNKDKVAWEKDLSVDERSSFTYALRFTVKLSLSPSYILHLSVMLPRILFP
jgi:hypothetical protein